MILVKLEFVGQLVEEGKPENPKRIRKKPSEQGREPTTNSTTYDAGQESNCDRYHIGGRRAADRGNFNRVYFSHALLTMSMRSSCLARHVALSRIPFMFSRSTASS